MRSPFPGMDPYLERHWLDIHHGLITYARDQLQPRLPKVLRARMEERVYVEPEDEPRRQVGSDVRVIERPRQSQRAIEVEESEGGVAVAVEVQVAAPVILENAPVPIHERIITIVDVSTGGKVVTVIEFVSPTNKLRGEGRELYLQKRDECFAGGINYVVIDLTRTGERYDRFLPFAVPRDLRQAYQAWARRANRPSHCEVYPLPLREKLPAIAIPLRESDRDVPLELQPLVDQCYRNGGFDDIDYTGEPPVPLLPEDAEWADQLLRTAGKR